MVKLKFNHLRSDAGSWVRRASTGYMIVARPPRVWEAMSS
jgi:hypothetical protein